MKLSRISLCYLAGLMLGTCLTACSYPDNPGTRIQFDPLTRSFLIKDTKDNDLSIKNFHYKDGSHDVGFDELSFVNNASTVREANAKQITAYTPQVEIMANVINRVFDRLLSIAPMFGGPMTTTTVDTPYGTVSRTVTPPTTQPAR